MRSDVKEDLQDLIQHYGYEAMIACLEDCVSNIEMDVLKFNLDSNNSNELVIRKARAEGARLSANAFKRRLESLRSKKNA